MSVQRTHTVAVQGQGTSVELDELRWLVAQLVGADGKSKVSVKAYTGDQRESGYVTLTANVPDAPPRPTVNHR